MLPPSCCHAAATQHWCPHRHRCAAAATTMLPRSCLHTAATAMLLPLPLCGLCCNVVTKLLPPQLPPRCRHRRRCCQAATITTKLPPMPLSTLWDRFDDGKELCKMTDIDFFWLSQLFWLGVKFLHGGMLSIFNTLVYLSLNHVHL